MEISGKKINFLGDSITEGAGASAIENVFWNVVAQKTGAVCRGYGRGGTRISRNTAPSQNPVSDLDFLIRADDMDIDADIIVVLGGTNDFGHGDARIGTMTDRDPHSFYGAMNLLCEKLINRYPYAQIVFMTPLHRLTEDDEINEIGVRNQLPLSGYVDIIKEVCRFYAIPVLDLFSVSGIQPRVPVLREKLAPDGLHPNDSGHEKIADKLISFLRTL